jgi:hypothetical protein
MMPNGELSNPAESIDPQYQGDLFSPLRFFPFLWGLVIPIPPSIGGQRVGSFAQDLPNVRAKAHQYEEG